MNKKKKNFFDFESPRFLALVIAAASLLAYSNTVFNNYNVDDELVRENHALKKTDLSTLLGLFSQPYYEDASGNRYEYRPVVMVSFFFEFLVFGKNPHVSHVINNLIYCGTCVIIFHLLLSLFTGLKGALPLSFAIALLFTLHPLHTEAVASIKNRDELLSLLLGASSWLFALRFADKQSPAAYFLYLFLFLAAIFSKQTTITFSILIPASLALFRNIPLTRYLALSIPVALIASVFSPIYLLYKKALVFTGTVLFLLSFYYLMARREELAGFLSQSFRKAKLFFLEKLNYKFIATITVVFLLLGSSTYFLLKQNQNTSGKMKQAQDTINDRLHDFNELQLTPFLQTPAPSVIPIAGRKLSFVETPLAEVHEPSLRLGTSLYALGVYLRLMLVPYPLSFYYGYRQIPIVGAGNAFAIFSLIAHTVFILLMLWLFFRKRHLVAAFGLLYYIVSIIPLSNLVTPIAGVVAERLSYSASLGCCISFCYLLFYPLTAEGAAKRNSALLRYTKPLFIALLVVFGALTFKRNFAWKDHLTLFRADIGHLGNSARAHHLYASHLAYSTLNNPKSPESVKKLKEAIPHFEKTIEIYPEFPYAWFDLAKTYLLLGDNNNAIKAYINSTKIDTAFAPPLFELGVVLTEAGRAQEAEQAYRRAIQKDSSFIQAYTNLSYLYYMQQRYAESIGVNELAARRFPNAYEPLVNLGRTYLKLQDNERALYYLEKAAAANPSDKSLPGIIADLYRAKGDFEREQYYRKKLQ